MQRKSVSLTPDFCCGMLGKQLFAEILWKSSRVFRVKDYCLCPVNAM